MPNGVEVRGKRMRVYFNYQGQKCREMLTLEPTNENIAYAERMAAQINHEIRNNTFNYASYFPKSKRLQDNTVGHYVDLLLEIKKNQVADSSHKFYTGIATRYIKPKFKNRQIDSIDYIELEEWRGKELDHLKSKTIKDIISFLRMVYALHRKRHPLTNDPTEGLVVKLPDDEEPDPFTRDEIQKIVETCPGSKTQELQMIKFNIWTGPRVSESIALAWEDVIDLDKGLIYFKRARVGTIFKATKTKRSKRIIQLLQPARDVLQEQWRVTGDLPAIKVNVVARDNRTIKEEELRFVFLNTYTGQHHSTGDFVRKKFFKPHLERAEVRYRGMNQCRHTFISQMLTANMPLQWISKQVGTSEEMIRRRYGKWIDEDATSMVSIAESRLNL